MNLNALHQVEKIVESNNHWNSSVSNFFANGWVDFHSEKRAFQQCNSINFQSGSLGGIFFFSAGVCEKCLGLSRSLHVLEFAFSHPLSTTNSND